MNLKTRISKLLEATKKMFGSIAGIVYGPGMAARLQEKDADGWRILPADPTPSEQVLWADSALMKGTFHEEPGTPEEAKRVAMVAKAIAIHEQFGICHGK